MAITEKTLITFGAKTVSSGRTAFLLPSRASISLLRLHVTREYHDKILELLYLWQCITCSVQRLGFRRDTIPRSYEY